MQRDRQTETRDVEDGTIFENTRPWIRKIRDSDIEMPTIVVVAHSWSHACEMRPSLKLKWSSDPVAFVKCRIVGQPNAPPSVQLSRNAKTSAAAILVVFGIDGLSTEECQTHVERLIARTGEQSWEVVVVGVSIWRGGGVAEVRVNRTYGGPLRRVCFV